MNRVYMNPEEIEKESMAIIGKEIGDKNYRYQEREIIKRIIHTTVDIDFGKNTIFNKNAITAGVAAIKAGKPIITDVNMVKAGIREYELKPFKNEVLCFLEKDKYAQTNYERSIPRAVHGIRRAIPYMQGSIIAIGNAPTALFEVIDLIKSSKINPALIIGVPVGFVGAAESKEELRTLDVPYITHEGRKGGSAVASAIVNELIKIILSEKPSEELKQSIHEKQKISNVGFTTGACAQAAAKAASYMLLNQRIINEIEVTLPNEVEYIFSLVHQKVAIDSASCGIIKNAGSNSKDSTNGIEIVAEVRFDEGSGIRIVAGEGVGRITGPGLPMKPGEPAINPKPREMILRDVKDIICEDKSKGCLVEIRVPQGKAIAEKTQNSQIGIEGGISIIGTSGLVQSKSLSTYTASLGNELNAAYAGGHTNIFIASGYISKRILKDVYGVPPQAIITVGDNIGFILKECEKKGIKKIVLAGHIGKLVKIAAGIFNTHWSSGDARMETISSYAALNGASQELVSQILECKLAEATIELLRNNNLMQTFDDIAMGVVKRSTKLTKDKMEIATFLLTLSGEVIGSYPKEIKRKEEWDMFIS